MDILHLKDILSNSQHKITPNLFRFIVHILMFYNFYT